MQIPVDVKAVIDEATNIDEARQTPLSVSVYIDESAPGDVVARVRGAFASASPHARVSLTYLDGRPFAPYAGDDMAVIVAGLSDQVGAYADELRAAGVPVMVATTMPSLVAEIAAVARPSHPARRRGGARCAGAAAGRLLPARRGRRGACGRRRALRARRARRRLARPPHGRVGHRRVPRQAPGVRAGVPVRAPPAVRGRRERHVRAERRRRPRGVHSRAPTCPS